MTESKFCVSNDCSETKFHKNLKTFVYTWKITNFQDLYNEFIKTPIHSCVSSESGYSDYNNEQTFLWSVKLYLSCHPSYVQDKSSFSANVDFHYKLLIQSYDYLDLKVFIINKHKTENLIYQKRQLKTFPISINPLINKEKLLNDKNELLSDGDLTLKFCLMFTSSKFLYTNPTSDNFSNMSTFSGLESMFNNEKFSDVKIAIGGKRFYMHKVILAARSSVFAAMFEHPMKENIENVVEITDIDYKTMQELLYFIYTGKINNIEDIAYDLLCAADKYDIEELRIMCEESLIKQLKVENVIDLLIRAEKFRAKLLKESALQYFKLHLKEIVQTEVFNSEVNSFIHLVPDMFKSFTI